jgi:hypothetical protein
MTSLAQRGVRRGARAWARPRCRARAFTPALGHAAAPRTRLQSYVALGDSYTAGPLIPVQETTPLGCLRSDHNYPHLVAAGRGRVPRPELQRRRDRGHDPAAGSDAGAEPAAVRQPRARHAARDLGHPRQRHRLLRDHRELRLAHVDWASVPGPLRRKRPRRAQRPDRDDGTQGCGGLRGQAASRRS